MKIFQRGRLNRGGGFTSSFLLLVIVTCGIFSHIFFSNVLEESTTATTGGVAITTKHEHASSNVPDESTTSSGVAITTKNEQQATQQSTQKCDETILPLIASSSSSSPRNNTSSMELKECWPKIFFLPSFPTSGNGMIRTMFMRLTRLHRTSVYEEDGKLFMQWENKKSEPIKKNKKSEPFKKKNQNGPFKIYYNDIHDPVVPHPIIPYGDYPTLTKTHYSNMKMNIEEFGNTQAQINGTMPGFTSGIVRIVRNPGDQLLRNQVRFISCDKYKEQVSSSTEKEECYAKNARKYCSVQHLSIWLHLHKFWIDKFDSSIPQMVLHYEKVTSSDIAVASKELRGLLEFVGATYTTGDENKGDSFEKTVGDYIRSPEYEQGTLFAKICGVKKARELHEATQEITEKNGYSFDHVTGYWSVRYDAVGAI